MLKGIALTKKVRRRAILDAVSFEIPAGSTATVLGPSGSGKTTLLRTLMGLDRPDAGALYLGDRCLAHDGVHVPPERRDMSLVFQDFTLFPHLDVAANLSFGLAGRKAHGGLGDLLDLLEIGHLERRRIDKLSGGEQQRVALARALALRPRVLLMDEPFSNIDNMLRERLYGRLKERLAADGTTTLIATHDHKEAFFFSDWILVLKDGKLLDQNPPRLIYEQPADAWVAEFFGATNVLTGRELGELAPGASLVPEASYLIRPEGFAIGGAGGAAATLTQVVYYGAYQDLQVRLSSGLDLKVRGAGPHRLRPGENLRVSLRADLTPHRLPEPSSA